MTQWIISTPDGVEQFLHQKSFEASSFSKVAGKAGIEVPDDLSEHYQQLSDLKSVPTLQQVSKMFQSLDDSGHLYLQYRHLSGFIHPSSSTVLRYLDDDPERGVTLRATSEEFDVAPLLFTLSMSVMLAVAPCVDLVKSKPYKTRLNTLSERAQIPMWLTEDGKPPKKRI